MNKLIELAERFEKMPTYVIERHIDSLQQRIYNTNMYDERFHDYREYKIWDDNQWAIMDLLCKEMKKRLGED